jgi:glycosyltransferase involved in cell wall biosynthesis
LLSRILDRFIWRKIAHARAILKIFAIEADIVIASRANILVAVFLYRFKNYHKNIKYFYLPYEIYGHQTVSSSRMLKLFEKYCIKNIFEYVITQSDLRAEYYRGININLKIIVCRNFKLKKSHNITFKNRSEVNLIYLGLIINGRSLDTLVKSLDFLPSNYKLTFVGPTPDTWINTNDNLIQNYISKRRFEIKNEILEEEISSLLNHFDIGLISYDDSCLNNRLCCPAKLTDYLHSGLSVIAPNLPGMQELASLNKDIELFNFASPEALANSIVKVNSSLRNREDIIKNSKNLCWESEFQKILFNLR